MRAADSWRRFVLLALLLLATGAAQAGIPKDIIAIGVLDSGAGGYTGGRAHGAQVAAEMAAADFGRTSGRIDAEILVGNSGADPVQALAAVPDWLDHNDAAAIVDSIGTGGAAGLAKLVAEKGRALLVSALAADPTPALCAPNVLRWGPDLRAYAVSLVAALAPRGDKRWFVIASADAAASAMQRDVAGATHAAGATLVGSVVAAPGLRDFTPDLLAASKKGAQVIVLALGGRDLADAVRQAASLGLTASATVAAPLAHLADIEAIGLDIARGIVVPSSFYWDQDDRTRAFSRRFAEREDGRLPTANQAAVHELVAAYLAAAKAADSIDAGTVLAHMRASSIESALFGRLTPSAEGTVPQPVGVFRVKRPEQSQRRWDDYVRLAIIPAAQAFALSGCRGQ